jgi:hypothetical protein
MPIINGVIGFRQPATGGSLVGDPISINIPSGAIAIDVSQGTVTVSALTPTITIDTSTGAVQVVDT